MATTKKSLSQRLAILGKKIQGQRVKSEKVLQHAQAALKHSRAARQHFLDHMHKVRAR